MKRIKNRPIPLAVVFSLVALVAIFGLWGAAPALAESPNIGYFSSLDVERQTVELLYPDGSRQTAQIEGHINGRPGGTASGTFQVEDGSQMLRYQVTEWSIIRYDGQGRGITVELVDSTGSVLEFKFVADPQQSGHRFEMNLDDYSIQAFQGITCDVFYDADGYPWWVCWDEEDTLVTP